MITKADLLAVSDVLDALLGEIDDLDAGAAIEMRALVHAVGARAKMCAELLETRALQAMDGQPVKVGGAVWTTKRAGKWRPDHRAIRDRIAEIAQFDEDGERLPARAQVRRAIQLCYGLFVSPGTFPKQAGLEAIRASNKSIGRWEHTRNVLALVDEEDDEDANP